MLENSCKGVAAIGGGGGQWCTPLEHAWVTVGEQLQGRLRLLPLCEEGGGSNGAHLVSMLG